MNEIPRSLLLSTTVNSFSCIVVAILVTFCAGDSALLDGPLATSGHPLGPILQLFLDAARGNKSTACSVFALSAVIFAVATVNTATTSSRMLFSLIRDGRDPIVTKLFMKVSARVFLSVESPTVANTYYVGSQRRRPSTKMRRHRMLLAAYHLVDKLRLFRWVSGDCLPSHIGFGNHILYGLGLFLGRPGPSSRPAGIRSWWFLPAWTILGHRHGYYGNGVPLRDRGYLLVSTACEQ